MSISIRVKMLRRVEEMMYYHLDGGSAINWDTSFTGFALLMSIKYTVVDACKVKSTRLLAARESLSEV